MQSLNWDAAFKKALCNLKRRHLMSLFPLRSVFICQWATVSFLYPVQWTDCLLCLSLQSLQSCWCTRQRSPGEVCRSSWRGICRTDAPGDNQVHRETFHFNDDKKTTVIFRLRGRINVRKMSSHSWCLGAAPPLAPLSWGVLYLATGYCVSVVLIASLCPRHIDSLSTQVHNDLQTVGQHISRSWIRPRSWTNKDEVWNTWLDLQISCWLRLNILRKNTLIEVYNPGIKNNLAFLPFEWFLPIQYRWVIYK